MTLFRLWRWKLRWWSVNRRLHKLFRDPVKVWLCVLLVAGVSLGISLLVVYRPSLPLRRAQIALDHRKPHLALQFVDALLTDQPAHATALRLKARAHMMAMQLDDARLALRRLIGADPNAAVGHKLLAEWVLLKIHRLASDKSQAENPQLQAQYEQTTALGLTQADWLLENAVGAVEARYLRARLARADVQYLRAMLKGKQRSTPDAPAEGRTAAQALTPPNAEAETDHLERQVRMKLAELEDHLRAVIAMQPDHIQAWRRYTSLLVKHKDWPELWAAATRVNVRQPLPLNMSVALVDAILAIPDAMHPMAERIELSRRMLSQVKTVNCRTPLWELARARLHLCADEPDKAQPLLERVLKAWPEQPDARWLLAGSLFNQRMYADAVEILGPLTLEMSDTVDVRTLYGLALMQTGDIDLAESVLHDAVGLKTGGHRADTALLALMGQQGRAAEVEEIVRRHYQRNGADPLAIQLMAQLEKIDSAVENKSGFARFGGPDRLLEFFDWWIESNPEQAAPLLAKGGFLMTMGRPAQAVKVIRSALRLAPNDVRVFRALSEAYLSTADYPAAEATLGAMGDADSEAKIEASAELARMYTMIGLRPSAVATLQHAEHLGPPRRPRVQLTMGQTLFANGRPEQARQHLADVPPAAPQYAAAQVLLACIERTQGLGSKVHGSEVGDSRSSTFDLRPLLQDQRTREASVRELLDGHAAGVVDDELIRYSAKLVPLKGLPGPLLTRWLTLQVGLAAQRGDWGETLTALDRLSAHDQGLQVANIARIVVLAHHNRWAEARLIFQEATGLPTAPLGPLVAAVLGESPPDDGSVRVPSAQRVGAVALSRFLELVLRGEVQEAARIAQTVTAPRAVFATDLIASLHQPGIDDAQHTEAYRRLGMAYIAYQAGLAGLCTEISSGVIADFPAIALAHALCVQTQLDRDRSTVGALTRLNTVLPHSSLSLLLSARESAANARYGGAIDDLRRLQEREPENRHVRYLMSQQLLGDGQADVAIALLEELHTGSNLRTQAGNDAVDLAVKNNLAYLLAAHRPDRLDDAYRIASQATGTANFSAPILDTLGWIEHLRGDDTQALTTLCRAVAMAGAEPQIHQHLAAVYAALGNDTWSRYHSDAANDLVTKVATRTISATQLYTAR